MTPDCFVTLWDGLLFSPSVVASAKPRPFAAGICGRLHELGIILPTRFLRAPEPEYHQAKHWQNVWL
jgi:hypothetical protein